ncbi:MAG TPA: RNA 2',3'-cyclic phosphodiesterase [Syntrophomonadaceae bacterium]|nr:RNA 2',3'-cyclic phosphodiesterase [Syntrophomonadaceae bacterium]
MRAFIAIPIPPNIKNLAASLQARLSQINTDVKWVEKDNYHLTLKFLGDVDQNTIENTCKHLDTITLDIPKFELRTNQIDFFPHAKRPRVIWLGISGDLPQANYLVDQIDDYLVNEGLELGRKRSFHLTLGRIRSGKGQKDLMAAILQLNNKLKEYSFIANKLDLMESKLYTQGPIYRVYKSFEFRG